MKVCTSYLFLIVALVACGCDPREVMPSSDQNPGTTAVVSTAVANVPLHDPKDAPCAGTYAGEWSEPVNGLSARLLVTLHEGGKSSLWATPVILEVKNTYSTPLAFMNQPVFSGAAVRDANGNELPEASHPGNHLTGEPQWAVIPGNAYLGFRVDTSIPVEHGLCFGFIPPEARTLSATLVAILGEGPENQWVGEISIPPVVLTASGAAP